VLVDDSEEFRASAPRLLEAQGLVVVAVARSLDDGRREIERHAPDVALVDVFLGEEDGTELVRVAAERAPATRVVLISALEREELDERLAGCSAGGFLPKPAVCAAAIRRLLRA
jgi:DNA-binding NarL/FixJ family response regulator